MTSLVVARVAFIVVDAIAISWISIWDVNVILDEYSQIISNADLDLEINKCGYNTSSICEVES